MRNVLCALTLITVLALVLLGCSGRLNNPVQVLSSSQDKITSLGKSGASYPSANGQGSLVSPTSQRIFVFHAATRPDGSVEGQGMLTRVSSDPEMRVQFFFDINCLHVDGNVAIMSGILTGIVRKNVDDSADPIEVGQYIQFKVIDNGEGAKAPPDQMSYFDHGPEVPPCDTDVGWNLFPIATGNIQVKY